jgi:ABC-type nitrate/sulfonate/bicarbonate transport system permease component
MPQAVKAPISRQFEPGEKSLEPSSRSPEALARQRARRSARQRRRLQMSLGFLSVLVVISAYTVLTQLPGSNPALLPPPAAIVKAFINGVEDGSLLSATASSLGRVGMGYVAGCMIAIIIGSLRGWYTTIGYLLDPIIDALRPVPALAYIPLVILWFGIGETARVLVIGFASFLSCVVSVTAGMKEVPSVYVEAARTLGASERRVFLTVALPSSLPYVFAGLRVAIGAAWGTLVAAELIAAQNGLGYLLQAGQEFFHSEIVIVALIIIGVIGFIMDFALKALQTWVLRWSPTTGWA